MKEVPGPGIAECGLLVVVAALGAAVLGQQVFPGRLEFVATGLGRTLAATGCAWLIGLAVAGALTLALAARGRVPRWSAHGVLAAGRGIPLVCTLFLAYWLPPLLGLEVPPFWCAVVAIGGVEGCYLAVVLDGLRARVVRRFREIAFVLCLDRGIWWRRILLPQVGRLATPHLSNFTIYTLKSTALAAFIAVNELTQTMRIVASATQAPAMCYAFLFCIYLALGAGLMMLGHWLRDRLGNAITRAPEALRDV